MSENRKINAIYKSREMILEILEKRDYNISDYSGFSVNEIHALYSNQQLDLLVNNKNKKTYIKYYLDKPFKVSALHDIIEDLFNIDPILKFEDDLIIIIKDEPNESLQKAQRSIYAHDKIFVTIINIERLQFNILKHKMVPDHIILTDEEKEEIKKKYNINDDKRFPEISRFDPVAQVLCLRPGQLCKIIRPSKTAILSNFYRICI